MGYLVDSAVVLDALLRFNTRRAVEVALDQALSMMEYCNMDTMLARNRVPGLCLRLGRDQECYNFCKAWMTNPHWDFEKSRAPIDIKKSEKSDAMESVNPFLVPQKGHDTLIHTVSVTLIKIRLYIDLVCT